MAQIWIEIEENENCGYHPVQTFEIRGSAETGALVEVAELPGTEGPQQIVGWCSEGAGTPCEVTVVLVGDSGAGESRLVKGGDNGVRIRRSGVDEEWSLDSTAQHGEPYVLLASDAAYEVRLS